MSLLCLLSMFFSFYNNFPLLIFIPSLSLIYWGGVICLIKSSISWDLAVCFLVCIAYISYKLIDPEAPILFFGKRRDSKILFRLCTSDCSTSGGSYWIQVVSVQLLNYQGLHQPFTTSLMVKEVIFKIFSHFSF